MIKRIIAAFAIIVVMMIAGSIMFGNASALPGFPKVKGEVIYDGLIDEGRINAEIIKVNEDSYRVQLLYTQKGMQQAFAFDGKVTGCQVDMVVNKEAMTELTDEFSELKEIKL